jgi:hypothetical protein
VFSTPQAVLALGAPSLADLSIAGASAAAPVLECDVAEPSDDPSSEPTAAPTGDGGAGPTITLPPTDGVAATSGPTDGAATVAVAVLIVLAAAGGAFVTGRRRAPR